MNQSQHSKLYRQILTTISTLYGSTRVSMIESYWKTGQYIIEVEHVYNAKAEYGDRLIERLSRDLT